MKDPLYFELNAFFILKLFGFLNRLFFVNVGKQLEKKSKINFKIYEIKDWETNNCNTPIACYLKRSRQPGKGKIYN